MSVKVSGKQMPNGVRSVRDLVGVTPVKERKREQEEAEKAFKQRAGRASDLGRSGWTLPPLPCSITTRWLHLGYVSFPPPLSFPLAGRNGQRNGIWVVCPKYGGEVMGQKMAGKF